MTCFGLAELRKIILCISSLAMTCFGLAELRKIILLCPASQVELHHGHLHLFRVPMDNFLLKIAIISSKTRCCCTETNNRILNYWFIIPDAFKEINKMFKMIIITRGGRKLYRLFCYPFLI